MKKTLRKFLRNKRAITPILSELLLMVIAVAAMSIATTATYVITTNLRDNMNERAVIEDVWFNSESQTVDIYVYNVGKVAITISNVYVEHVGYTSNLQLAVGEDGVVRIAPPWIVGETYYIDVLTSRGTHIAGNYKAT
ncbi:MAG: hypothetical protein NWF05_10730 [Candidatus Bathyarchaeota archaeon]|nr:hypothetical protein [Candidatus Bathyarchaeota archaeon]